MHAASNFPQHFHQRLGAQAKSCGPRFTRRLFYIMADPFARLRAMRATFSPDSESYSQPAPAPRPFENLQGQALMQRARRLANPNSLEHTRKEEGSSTPLKRVSQFQQTGAVPSPVRTRTSPSLGVQYACTRTRYHKFRMGFTT